jgi:septum formation topological specificity factor MinE
MPPRATDPAAKKRTKKRVGKPAARKKNRLRNKLKVARRMSGADAKASSGSSQFTAISYGVQLRYRIDDKLLTIDLTTDDEQLYPVVHRLRYVIANRRRITSATQESLSKDLLKWIRVHFAVDTVTLESRIKELARASVIEVRIPFGPGEVGWAAQLFPWESALWLLTRRFRDDTRDFTVVRFLDCATEARIEGTPASALVVRSAPGELNSLFDLDREALMVPEALARLECKIVRDPDRSVLQSTIVKSSPSVVHLAGVDPLALESANLASVDPEQSDGFVLRGGSADYDLVSSEDLAKILNSAGTKPLLVSISTAFSAPRVAARVTASGAQHAIGFYDTITDADAMLFFSVFYRAWAQDWDVLKAFVVARREWMGHPAGPTAQRTGVVLWSRKSLVEGARSGRAVTHQRAASGSKSVSTTVAPATPKDLVLHIVLAQDREIPGGVRSARTTSLNYSLLHNDRSPFSIFTIEKPREGKLPPLEIEVALEVGSEVCRCRFSEELPESIATVDLLAKIRLPLVAGLLRQCSESLRTNLYVRMVCGGTLLRETSERVTVLPADEWRDDGEDHRWLPSFVLPRDPAVLKIIASAQRYLCTLLDDCSAGFDGSQQLSPDESNAANIVDPQVQATWAALQHDLPVNYINPPPSYTSQSQRLRTPTEIFKGNAATCIDLALLFASCLEFIGIYAVIFLISGHAFPGYWRSDKAWWRMKRFQFDRNDQPVIAGGSTDWRDASKRAQSLITRGPSEAWMFAGVDNLGELLGYVQRGALVPFESTFVTGRRGFFESLEKGSSNLHPQTFDAMIDIQSARGDNVTPLPLLDRIV